MKNLYDLNAILFGELDRLDSAEGDDLELEINRAEAVSSTAEQIIKNGNLLLKAAQVGDAKIAAKIGRMLTSGKNDG